MKKAVHVAVGVVVNAQQEVLLSFRDAHQHQGNLWEFPGGKCEANERVEDALARELMEELNIQVAQAEPLCNVAHDYGDKQVLLDVWWVDKFTGVPKSNEGQRWRWVPLQTLGAYQFPAANEPILVAIRERVALIR
ncbi:mutator mutT protein [Idiomarinaceae bacterium HL-53]|nr:mutator mutT protein [Idiomarinaceae bacterium HL-53]